VFWRDCTASTLRQNVGPEVGILMVALIVAWITRTRLRGVTGRIDSVDNFVLCIL
jgi:hypothetical protein